MRAWRGSKGLAWGGGQHSWPFGYHYCPLVGTLKPLGGYGVCLTTLCWKASDESFVTQLKTFLLLFFHFLPEDMFSMDFREGEVREKHRCERNIHTHPDRGWNPQPGMCSDRELNLPNLQCTAHHSNQLSHTSQGIPAFLKQAASSTLKVSLIQTWG